MNRTSAKGLLAAACLGGALYACAPGPQTRMSYPMTQTDAQVQDTYFGKTIADPYRWLEDDQSEQTKAWVDTQNDFTQSYLAKVGGRDLIKSQLQQVLNYDRHGIPFQAGDYKVFSEQKGLQNQPVIYKERDGKTEVLLDPNALSKDGTVTAGIAAYSKDKQQAVVSINRAGSDWQEFHLLDMQTGKFTGDSVQWAKFSGVSWHDGGYFYSGYGQPKEGEALKGKNEYHKVFYHKVGTPQSQDILVYEDKAHALRNFGAMVTEDGRFLLLNASEGTHGAELLLAPLGGDLRALKPFVLCPGFAQEYNFVGLEGDKCWVVTDLDAPNFRLVEIDLKNPAPAAWKTLIAEQPEKLEQVEYVGGRFFVRYLKDVSSRLYCYSLQGKRLQELPLPALGTARFAGNEADAKEIYYSFTSFAHAPSIFRYDLERNQAALYKETQLPVDTRDYEVKQVFYPSKDGTKVPMFLIHKKGLVLDGTNPTYLYAYGGFSISVEPAFNPLMLPLLENGGVYAVANIRGGGEYGEAWHKAGMLLNKQNVFDDFIAAAQWLIDQKYTSPARLAISGRSNGGLLIGACMTQRPDLYRVAFPGVGVLDMLRYQKFTIGWAWGVEYGTSDDPKHFENLLRYSPLHNVRPVAYPSTMVLTADHDDRVVPAHSFKFAATLQQQQQGSNPILIRIDKKAGHGAGKPLRMQIEEWADVWGFMFHEMGVPVKVKS